MKPDGAAGLKGDETNSNTQTMPQPRQYRLVLLGAPGVGKGTQAELLAERFGAYHLSTGDLFRAVKMSKDERELTPTMARALEYMNAGKLVPDETVLALVAEHAKDVPRGKGFLLDGFPRTVAQAEALENALEKHHVTLDAVLNYELPLPEIVARLSGRRTCPKCKRVYHIEARPPKREGICDDCGVELFQRDDDRPETIRVRMEAYEKNTAPLTDFYRRKGLLISISAGATPAVTFERTLEALGAVVERQAV